MSLARPGVAQRRSGLLSSNPTTPTRTALSVEEWESKAPLDDLAVKSIALVKEASEKVPLPVKFSAADAEPSRPSTPILRGKLIGSGSRPSTPSASNRPLPTAHALDPKDAIQTPQQFYDWFAKIDRSVAHSQEAHFRAHVAAVTERIDAVDMILDRIDKVDKDVDSMLHEWRVVEEGGRSLKDACEKLLEEREQLIDLTDEIGSRLEYFHELEQATRMLNHPGESLVLQTDFLYMVERVDICIEYFESHRNFREADVYLLRFQQCMTRAMTLIKMFFVGSLRALTVDVSRRLSEKDVSSTAQTHLLYTRFRSVTSQLAPLLGELERRASAHPEELSALLSECHVAYFSARKGLLVNRLVEEIRGLDPAHTELVELTSAGCSYLKQLCTDEFDLFREFFNSGADQLYPYLENLCDYLYDDLRPRILHEQRLTTLCEVCTVLQALMVLDVSELPDEPLDTDVPDQLTMDFEPRKPPGLQKLHISRLLQMVLQDAQTRLFFKAQSVIQAEIRHYVPKPEDLAYPDKLVAQPPRSQQKGESRQLFQLPSFDKQETWFPTLQKCVWVLSQLHDFVKPAIFEDIAQEAVSLCRQSLVSASNSMKNTSSSSASLDSDLFLVRHLLILKEVANNLDYIQQDTKPGPDYGGVADTLALLVNKTTSFLPEAIFSSLRTSRGHDSFGDAKVNIDQDLRKSCREVISSCSTPIGWPLRDWTDRVRALTSRTGTVEQVQTSLMAQEWAQQAAAENLHKKFIEACERDLRSSVARMKLYLEDSRTVSVLVTHVQETIEDDYATFRDVVWTMYAGSLRDVVLSTDGLKDLLAQVCE
ncbi:Sec34-domain-containing protein [Coniophora puteana RWD-64-598 SS2]|uniref:Conserved oligomeric Golgi complex subunit 3 n=1 Tax=Coniophora puteana (strain RWD-64-598) TaxID=741705 RepID=A0A5M3MWN3_CONPW|nr:Sec34-domain-containing protein [Coniophora puteana RWD-64-598 SS2]EIW83115.1 Sec34-domain-containing protein [Coniophora puteana RWD-64-598 SS2]